MSIPLHKIIERTKQEFAGIGFIVTITIDDSPGLFDPAATPVTSPGVSGVPSEFPGADFSSSETSNSAHTATGHGRSASFTSFGEGKAGTSGTKREMRFFLFKRENEAPFDDILAKAKERHARRHAAGVVKPEEEAITVDFGPYVLLRLP